MPPYPPESFAAEEQGTSVVEVHITTAGTVDNCIVFQSSGFARLDQATCDHIQNVWQWQPPTQNGVPYAVRTRVSVKWDIKGGLPPQ
ncbi:MAG TPA: energy transducer TonB [Rhizomicrobium sp.]|nr:energy transducer TonB [Rhizomicrobium sp.]